MGSARGSDTYTNPTAVRYIVDEKGERRKIEAVIPIDEFRRLMEGHRIIEPAKEDLNEILRRTPPIDFGVDGLEYQRSIREESER